MGKITNLAFSKGGDALFLVMSPFQLLCALEAISAFEIEEYLFEFVFVREYKHRNEQMLHMANAYQIPNVVKFTDSINTDTLYASVPQLPNKYETLFSRVFVGDCFSKHLYVEAFRYARKGGLVLFLDDGTSTIVFLRNISSLGDFNNWIDKYNYIKHTIGSYMISKRILKAFKKNDVYLTDCFFTMYSNVQTKKHVYPNEFKRLASEVSNKRGETAVFIIGTVVDEFASSVLQVKGNVLEGIIWDKLSSIRAKYYKDKIIYVPHPRDYDKIIPEFCKILGIDYRKLDESVESFLLSSHYQVKAIYGFGSTALGVLKKIFIDSKITNYSIQNGKKCSIYNAIYEYYDSIGIKNDTVTLKAEGDSHFIRDFFQNFYGFVAFICSKIHKRIK